MTTVNLLVPHLRCAAALLLALAGCGPTRAAREDRAIAELMRERCPSSLLRLPDSPYFAGLNVALDAGDLDAVEFAGQAMLATLRRDVAWVFHSPVAAEGPDRDAAIYDMRVALDALSVGPGAPLRLGTDRFVLAPEPAARLIAAALQRGDRDAALAWLEAAEADAGTASPLSACRVAADAVGR
jgi:hypothetical protein